MTTYTSPSGLVSASPEHGPLGDEIPDIWNLLSLDGRNLGYITTEGGACTWTPHKAHGITHDEAMAVVVVISMIEDRVELDIQGGQA